MPWTRTNMLLSYFSLLWLIEYFLGLFATTLMNPTHPTAEGFQQLLEFGT